ncbi:MAG: YdcF family protein [Lachnospiraceae bacterium]
MMISFGIFCIVYYLVIRIYTKKWDSTFSLFWLGFGTAHIGIGLILRANPLWIQNICGILMVILWAIFLAVEIIISSAMMSVYDEHLSYIIVLGAKVDATRITCSLNRRLEKAEQYLKRNPDTTVIVSGGQGKGESITEASAMAEYLKNCGISETRIVLEDRSTNTKENLQYCKKYVNSYTEPIGIVTNNFHMYRALWLGKIEGYTRLQGIPASTNLIIFPNYMVREFFAVLQLKLKSFQKK